jgi:primosomal protein N' (replication factor Y) (superfamily II helicase)
VIARVAVMLPVGQPFDYVVPQALVPSVRPGVRVWAPWGRRSIEGVVVGLDPPDSPGDLKSLTRLVDAPALPAPLIELATWIAEYYMAPPGEVMRLLLPAGGRARARRTVTLTDEGVRAVATLGAALEDQPLHALDAVTRALLRALRERPLAEATLLAAPDGAQAHAPRERTGGARGGEQERDERRDARKRVSALLGLVERGWVEIVEDVRTKGRRAQQWVKVARVPGDGELARAPKRLAVWQKIQAAGEIAVASLDDAAQVRALADAGLVRIESREVGSDPFAAAYVESAMPTPNAAQAAALDKIDAALEASAFAPFLLHGVTGSGKTEVYLRAIAATLARGRTALVLVPEISLTPQLAARFRGRFGHGVAVLHSALSDAARSEAWQRIRRGEVSIALGARSAVFAPLEQLGMVVIDEEHDPSFKQQDGVRYHGRDVALVRARAAGAVVVLGSATPSMETWAASQDGRFTLLELPERATPRPLPAVEILDLRQHKIMAAHGSGPALISAPLAQAIETALAAGEQTLLFLNRRGFATFILCKSCGVAARCRDCSVTLTYHRGADQLQCHYCGFRTATPRVCAGCGSRALERLGFGTEQVEAVVRDRFPDARVARLDRDTAEGAGLERVLDGVRRGDIDILVGTQMITKGHDFPSVTLVGVVLADHGMGLPDFRADERTFQLLEQVAGRAGRGDRPGRVLVQTYSPQHPAVTCARDHAFHRFAELELAVRREGVYPPFVRLACVHVDGADPVEVRAVAEAAATAVRAACGRAPDDLGAALLGPAEAPLGRLKGRTRWQLFCKAKTARALRVLCRAALGTAAPKGIRVSADIDPTSML